MFGNQCHASFIKANGKQSGMLLALSDPLSAFSSKSRSAKWSERRALLADG
jgi:hypothetical protein